MSSVHLGDKHVANFSCADIHLRSQISQPYNFQHLTHTYANQLTKLDKASHSQLVSEFSAIRASQVPRTELMGIKAERLYCRSSSLEELHAKPLSPNWSLNTTSPPISPRSLQHHRFNKSHPQIGSLPYCRSVENFSQPSPKSYKSLPTAITPPPRISSKKSAPAAFTIHEPAKFSSTKGTASNDALNPASPTTCTILEWEDNLIDYSTTPHAVSTPDESALTLQPTPSGTIRTELDDVPEEDEVSRWRRKTAPKSPPTPLGSGLRHSQSYPIVKAAPFRWSNPSSGVPACSPVSPMSEIPRWTESMIPSIDQPLDDIPLQPRLSRRVSTGLNGTDCCWEDDIDYCYEHAAEADCEFDWDRISLEDGDDTNQTCETVNPDKDFTKAKEEDKTITGFNNHEPAIQNNCPIDLSLPFSMASLETSTPELEISPRDSTKSSTASLGGPITPSHSIISPSRIDMQLSTSKRSNLPDFGSSLFITSDFESQLMPEDLYQRIFAGDHLPEQHYPFNDDCIDTVSTRDSSPRSSHLPISKSNSQESFLISQSASPLRHHRDSNSVSSLPELVHSNSTQSNDPAWEGALDSAAMPNYTGSVAGHQSSQLVRPRRSQSLAKEVARQSVLQKLAVNSQTLYQEKPLPCAPDSQSLFNEKPLPVTPTTVFQK